METTERVDHGGEAGRREVLDVLDAGGDGRVGGEREGESFDVESGGEER